MYNKVEYKLKYGYLDSRLIANCNGPETKCSKRTAEEWVTHYNKISNDFYTKLEHSIKEKGVLDPVVILSGDMKPRYFKYLPEYMKNDKNQILACIGPGCSRLYICQRLNITEIPVIVLDYNNRFRHFEVIENVEQLKAKWHQKPKDIILGRYELNIRGIPRID